ncbi:MAG: hypothetical protein AAFN05_07080, partial [Pseudomonadota bacterium]
IASGVKRPEFVNVFSPTDKIVRVLGARAAGKTASRDRGMKLPWWKRYARFVQGWKTIGIEGSDRDLRSRYENWVDIDLTSDKTQAWGAARDMDLKGTLRESSVFIYELLRSKFKKAEIWDHWVHYTHEGNWKLYRALLEPGELALSDLPQA